MCAAPIILACEEGIQLLDLELPTYLVPVRCTLAPLPPWPRAGMIGYYQSLLFYCGYRWLCL